MNSKDQDFNPIAQALPTRFDFYHLGKVELQSSLEQSLNPDFDCAIGYSAVGFQVRGDLLGWIVILYPKQLPQRLDDSTYSELGNILVSKMVTKLNMLKEMDVLISPPQTLQTDMLEKLTHSKSRQYLSSYIHYQESNLIPLEIWFLSASPEEIGNA